MRLFSTHSEPLPDRIFHEGLQAWGRITVKHNARRFTARWHGSEIALTCPPSATLVDATKALDAMAPRLRGKATTIRYAVGTPITLDGYTIHLLPGRNDNRVSATIGPAEAHVNIGTLIDLDSDVATATISKMLRRIAGKVAPTLLLPHAAEIAEQLDVAPSRWEISTGLKVLGHCSTSRVIALSGAVVFLPRRLRDYIVCHELAHLTEMNHSPRFHALCDTYCRAITAEPERTLVASLRRHTWPIIR